MRPRRALWSAGLVAFVVALLVVQIISDASLREVSTAAALIRRLPADRAVSPAAPALVPLRLALARVELARGDDAGALAWTQTLPDGRDARALRGALDERRGALTAATRAYLDAGDEIAAERTIAALDRTDPAQARALADAAVARFADARTRPDALAEALWQRGVLANQAARGSGDPRARRALDDYRGALALAPYSMKYLLAAGYQAIALGDPQRASGYFARASAADPQSAEAHAGLGAAALAAGDRATAAAELARARALDPTLHSVRSLATQLGS